MAQEAYVQVLCPECNKNWEETPGDLPRHDRNYNCPGCHATRRTAEFMRTERDLVNLKRLE